MSKSRFFICANIEHNSSEDAFYKIVLSSTPTNELILTNPDENPSNLSTIEPFKTKSKIKHSPPKSPPKSPLKSLPTSQENCFLEENNKDFRVSMDQVFKEGEKAVFKGLSRFFEDFIEGKTNVLLINWFKRLDFDGFLSPLIEKMRASKMIEFAINGLSEIEGKNLVKFEEIVNFERKFEAFKGNKLNFSGIIYRFRLKSPRKKYLIIIDLFNVIEKFNGVDSFYEALNNVGKGVYRVLTDKEEKKGDFTAIFAKIMKNPDFLIIPLINFKDIQPYYTHISHGMRFIEEIGNIAKKLNKSTIFEILSYNYTRLLEKEENFTGKNEVFGEDIEEKKTIEDLRNELKNKEEVIRKLSIVQEDKSLLEGILEETVTNSIESNTNINKKSKVFSYN